MQRSALSFDRPPTLAATQPAELREIARDEVRLLVSTPAGHRHAGFRQLADFLEPGDLVVVNRSATLPASLPARAGFGSFTLNLSTDYGNGLWLAEPRISPTQPGPVPLETGDFLRTGGVTLRAVAPHPGLSRLWFVQADGPLCTVMGRVGQPIRYGYVPRAFPLAAYQTLFARIPGSAEMPSAARPFTPRVVAALRRRGVKIAGITLHTGVSSLEVETARVEDHTLYAEPYHVSRATAHAVNRTRAAGGRVIAVGTTVVRALETAWDGHQVAANKGFTRIFIHPGRGVHAVDGLITGLHDPMASHLAMLYAVAGEELIRSAYAEAVKQGYLWHEFGDSHLIIRQ